MDSPLTLPDRIERATVRGAVTFIAGDASVRVPWAELHDDARAMAAALQCHAVLPGDHVAILGPTSRNLVTAIQATWLNGSCAVVMPLPMRLSSIDEFVRQTRQRILAASADLVLIDPQLAEFYVAEAGDPELVSLETLAFEGRRLGSESYDKPIVDGGDLAVLQFTSGSTSDPKGVELRHRNIAANLDAIAHAARLDVDDDVLVSWLPLYHDMGLIGKLTLPMTTGTDLVLAGPQDFMAGPSRWMQWMSDFGGTASAAPNFAYALAARALRRMDGLDLSRWRIALNGAEPVDPETVGAFVEAASRHGFDAGGVFPAFGMAEVAIGGTFPPPGRGIRTDLVDLRTLELERYAAPAHEESEKARAFALLGRPVPGLEMRVVDPDSGHELQEREAGELEIRGTSLTTGYYRNEAANEASFRDGWFRTGDLAYFVDGELVICGRLKDLIITGGRNVFPEDIERAVAEVEGVRRGNIIAFGAEKRRGKEQIVVVAESKAEDLDEVRAVVAAAVREAVGAPAGDVVLLEPGTLPKTSSGKLQRSACKRQYLEGELRVLVDA